MLKRWSQIPFLAAAILYSTPCPGSGYLSPTLGGIFSGVTIENPASIYWNPGAMGFLKGNNLYGDFGFVCGNGTAARLDPYTGDYEEPEPYSIFGPPFFAGATTDFGLDFLTAGLGIYTPYMMGAFFKDREGANRYHLREGYTFSIFSTFSVAIKPHRTVSIGFGLSYIFTDFYTLISYDLLPMLIKTIEEESGGLGYEHKWTDEDLESPEYESVIDLHHLKAHGFGFNAGLYFRPSPYFSAGLSYIHGVKIRTKGDVEVTTPSIPVPEEDLSDYMVDQFIESLGIRDQTFPGIGEVEFDYPPIINLGLSFNPCAKTGINLFGQYIFWSVFEMYDITISGTGQDVLDGNWQWAKYAVDAFSAGLSLFQELSSRTRIGGRVNYDSSAFPDETASPNTMDFPNIEAGLGVLFRVGERVEVGFEYSHYFLFERDIQSSKFMESAQDPYSIPEEYSFPSANGIYRGSLERFGIIVSSKF